MGATSAEAKFGSWKTLNRRGPPRNCICTRRSDPGVDVANSLYA